MARHLALAILAVAASLPGVAKAVPTVPTGYQISVVAQGGLLASGAIAGLAMDPNTGDAYVAARGGIGGSSGGFNLLRVTPSGAVTFVGGYGIPNLEIVELTFGPGDLIYTANTSGQVFQINPNNGALSLYSNSGIGLSRYSIEFDANGDLILFREATRFFRVLPGAGNVFLGDRIGPSHGDRMRIQPDGDYVIMPDGINERVAEYETAGHVVGAPFIGTALSNTPYLNGSAFPGIPVGNSIGAIDPVTGDVYSTTAFFGRGSEQIAFTPGTPGPLNTTTVFVDQIGDGTPGGTIFGVTDLEFGMATSGIGRSLFFIDDFSNTLYEVSGFDVPEPNAIALLGLGMLGLGVFRRKKA